MPIRFRLLTESDVKTVLTMDDLIETMASAIERFSTGRVADLGELVAGTAAGRLGDADVTICKSLGLAVEDVTAADLAYRRTVERGVGLTHPACYGVGVVAVGVAGCSSFS